jgi:hypothetical protein
VIRAAPLPLLSKGQLPHGRGYLICPEHDAAVRRGDLEGIADLGFNTALELFAPAFERSRDSCRLAFAGAC